MSFIDEINAGYTCENDYITLGTAMLDGHTVPNTLINVALRTLNRHGLIAGATGTGKTITVQMLVEQLSSKGIPTLLMDLKGDLSGLAAPGTVNAKIEERQNKIGIAWQPERYPVEFLSLSDEPGVRLRSNFADFGPILLAQILGLSETQAGVLAVVFKYCEDNNLPLIDLQDLKTVINHLTQFESQYGLITASTTGSILRKILALEQQNADRLFGEPAFDVYDLLNVDHNGHGKVNILRVTDLQDRPNLFSTFMLGLLSDVYRSFPEVGDASKPKLVLFIDEAHLIFNNASVALQEKIATIIKLIRSKGVGIFFCTQDPTDIPANILSQLGLKVQHALRAFTAKDHKAIKMSAENYPVSQYYDTAKLLTMLGIGEALVSALDEKGRPTPLAATLLQAPRSRMGLLTATELAQITQQSFLVKKYERLVQRESAHTILVQQQHTTQKVKKIPKENILKKLGKMPLFRQVINTIVRECLRAILIVLGIRKYRR